MNGSNGLLATIGQVRPGKEIIVGRRPNGMDYTTGQSVNMKMWQGGRDVGLA
jgi:hypothetical protein